MYDVYRIYVAEGCVKRAYNVIRRDDWSVKKVATFNSIEKAENYIKFESMQKTVLPTYTVNLHTTYEKQVFINKFCFEDDMYLLERRLFLGYPNIPRIQNALEKIGVNVQR